MKQKTPCFNLNFVTMMVSSICISLLLTGCQPQNKIENKVIKFGVSFSDTNLNCEGMKFESQSIWQVHKLRFFISEIALKKDGQWHPVSYKNNPWQSNSTALISLTAQTCDDPKQFNDRVEFSSEMALQAAQGLRFKLGVPFEINHLNPLLQPSPLNLPDMFWSWQLGHKFLRLDMENENRNWAFHLGSIGCQSDSRIRPPKSPCLQPNLIDIELPAPKSNSINLKLDQLLQQLPVNQASSCMFSANASSTCETLLNNLQQRKVFVWQ